MPPRTYDTSSEVHGLEALVGGLLLGGQAGYQGVTQIRRDRQAEEERRRRMEKEDLELDKWLRDLGIGVTPEGGVSGVSPGASGVMPGDTDGPPGGRATGAWDERMPHQVDPDGPVGSMSASDGINATLGRWLRGEAAPPAEPIAQHPRGRPGAPEGPGPQAPTDRGSTGLLGALGRILRGGFEPHQRVRLPAPTGPTAAELEARRKLEHALAIEDAETKGQLAVEGVRQEGQTERQRMGDEAAMARTQAQIAADRELAKMRLAADRELAQLRNGPLNEQNLIAATTAQQQYANQLRMRMEDVARIAFAKPEQLIPTHTTSLAEARAIVQENLAEYHRLQRDYNLAVHQVGRLTEAMRARAGVPEQGTPGAPGAQGAQGAPGGQSNQTAFEQELAQVQRAFQNAIQQGVPPAVARERLEAVIANLRRKHGIAQ